MIYDKVLKLLESNSDLDVVRRMKAIGLDPRTAFAGGDWRNCNFANLDLQGFDMRNGDFRGANFYRANVTSADFRNSEICGNLSVAEGFDGIIIDKKSSDAIKAAFEKIDVPKEFLIFHKIFEDENDFLELIKYSIIEFGLSKKNNSTYTKNKITYKKIYLKDFVLIRFIEFINNDHKRSDYVVKIEQFIESASTFYKKDQSVNLLILIEASKFIGFDDFRFIIWPYIKVNIRFISEFESSVTFMSSEFDRCESAFQFAKQAHNEGL